MPSALVSLQLYAQVNNEMMTTVAIISSMNSSFLNTEEHIVLNSVSLPFLDFSQLLTRRNKSSHCFSNQAL